MRWLERDYVVRVDRLATGLAAVAGAVLMAACVAWDSYAVAGVVGSACVIGLTWRLGREPVAVEDGPVERHGLLLWPCCGCGQRRRLDQLRDDDGKWCRDCAGDYWPAELEH